MILQQIYYRFHRGQTQDERFRTFDRRVRGLIRLAASLIEKERSLSRVYLVRHGQAGTRKAYDSLSDLGRRQARMLGEYFVAEKIHFAAAYSGALVRQEETAAEVRAAYREAGVCFPEIVREPGWNEFDLAHVYRALAPQLCAEDPEFEREYQELVAQARAAAEQPEASVNRRWLPCDVKVVEAWMRGRHAYDGETWQAFRERVVGCQSKAGTGASATRTSWCLPPRLRSEYGRRWPWKSTMSAPCGWRACCTTHPARCCGCTMANCGCIPSMPSRTCANLDFAPIG